MGRSLTRIPNTKATSSRESKRDRFLVYRYDVPSRALRRRRPTAKGSSLITMRPTRKPKLAAREVLGELPSNSDSEDTISSEEEYDSDAKPPPKKVRHVASLRIEGSNELIPADTTWEECEAKIAFCCSQCYCSEEIRAQIPHDNAFVRSSDDGLFHRRCCHGLIEDPYEDWMCQYEKSSEELAEALKEGHSLPASNPIVEIPENQWAHYVEGGYVNSKTWETQIYNSDGLPGVCLVSRVCVQPVRSLTKCHFGRPNRFTLNQP
jgi:hypothetical protein